MDKASQTIMKYKSQLISNLLSDYKDDFWVPFGVYVGVSTALFILACLPVVLFEPIAYSSGIPEVKCYLNGVRIPRLLRWKTLLIKIVGSILATGGNVAGDKEGPLVHIGATVAAAISQGKSSSLKFDSGILKFFRTDNEKRLFISCGASAGIAAGFGAPIGGVLYMIEEGMSFWSAPLTAFTFFCCACSISALNFFREGSDHSWGYWSYVGLLDFGRRELLVPYTIKQFPFYIMLGILGGLLGAIFNFFNKWIHTTRVKLKHPVVQGLEMLALGLTTSVLFYIIPYYYPSCKVIGKNMGELTVNTLFCPEGQYNQIGTILFQNEESSLRAISTWDYMPLFMICALYFVLTCWTFGAAVPVGILAPCLLIGACYGRMLGQYIQHIWPEAAADESTFSILGAASMLAGTTRLTLSLAVILTEATNNAGYTLPIMLVAMIARLVGYLFINGCFNIHIDIAKLPLLDWWLPSEMMHLRAKHVMSKPPIYFRQIEKVSIVHRVLSKTTHNGFPVVDKKGHLLGVILRWQLVILLMNKRWYSQSEVQDKGVQDQNLLSVDTFLDYYPRYPDIDQVHLGEDEKKNWLALAPYMNANPVRVLETCPMRRVFRVFRTMGLRHLIVVDKEGVVVGVITRKDMSARSTLAKLKTQAMRQPSLYQFETTWIAPLDGSSTMLQDVLSPEYLSRSSTRTSTSAGRQRSVHFAVEKPDTDDETEDDDVITTTTTVSNDLRGSINHS
ncbi:chloride transporter, chloride channel (ClC) subfamily protein [Acanthamoeba castellanii str. Neff]|uniref:Chloride channel protein n=1 Tax=Acanthamoeba castellanii (strain ATCC 30010 / Neff) TaxID=1257118 RepID=L8HHM6_ACACF|nr:chloride transporter, chloride channel (ClC) subfamily protein [Acanthamoeba castellanii str. Neff]ELR24670.1 chloride transporter, chloride channel (ClC) subfamily protein [Acanthamoeba castellanii str. Neff]